MGTKKQMSEKATKIPQIRFDGYTDAWEQRKLKELGDIQTGNTPSTSNADNYSIDGMLWVTPTDIKSLVISDTSKKLSEAGVLKARIAKAGSILVTSIASIGKNTLVTKDVGFNQQINALTPTNNNDSYFLLTQSEKWSAKMKQTAAAATMQIVNKTDFSNISTLVPVRKDEQKKIGTFFKQLDDLIALHQRECDLLAKMKKSYLQKMFPKNGEDKPEIRFAGFTDAWELRKLNEVSDIYDGTHQTPKYQDDGVMFLSVENIKTLTSNKFISREAFEVEFKIRPQRGDVLMTRIGDIGTANVVETDEDLAYYVSLALFKSEELNPYFLQASIYAPFVQDQIWKRTLHIAFPKKINKNEIGQVPINVPTLAEQTKIGSFFKQLDNTITLHQRELDSLKKMKKSLLQMMFV